MQNVHIEPEPDGRAAAGRAALIAGFHELAEFLEANPDVPAPSWADICLFPHGTDADQIAEVDHVAGQLGVEATWNDNHSHYTACRRFGPVELKMVAISEESYRAWEALMSYSSAVQPEGGAA